MGSAEKVFRFRKLQIEQPIIQFIQLRLQILKLSNVSATSLLDFFSVIFKEILHDGKANSCFEHIGMAISIKVKEPSKWIIKKAHKAHSNQTLLFCIVILRDLD